MSTPHPAHAANPARRVVVLPASTRSGSLNRALAVRIAARFTQIGDHTVDWLTRVDVGVLAGARVLVAAASPGRGGGANGAAMVIEWMRHMAVDIAERPLTIGRASITPSGDLDGVDDPELARFVAQSDRVRTAA